MGFNLKKIRFVILSVILVSISFVLATWIGLVDIEKQGNAVIIYVILGGVLTISSSLFVQYLGGGEKGIKFLFFSGTIPFLLNLSCFLFFLSYPNLTVFLKTATLIFYIALLYTLYLLNNVILVVESREANIPVYRVAVNWVQIVLLSIAIPLFTSLFKVLGNPLLQIITITLSAFIFYFYLTWVYSNEKDIRMLKSFGSLVLSGSFSMLVGWAVFSILFIPTESFLRGIFISSVFLVGLGYVQLYLRNSLSKKNLWDYAIICLTFGGIVVLFRP